MPGFADAAVHNIVVVGVLHFLFFGFCATDVSEVSFLFTTELTNWIEDSHGESCEKAKDAVKRTPQGKHGILNLELRSYGVTEICYGRQNYVCPSL